MLKESRGYNYKKKLQEAIKNVKKGGYEEIKASIDPYQSPKAIVSQSSDLAFVPDLTAQKKGAKAYFEISKRGDDPEQVGSKWRLLSMMANMKKGVFKIFVPYGSMPFTQRVINQYNIKAELVKI